MKDIASTAFLLSLTAMSAAFLIAIPMTGRIQPRYGGKAILRSETPVYFWSCYAVFVVGFSFGIFMCLRQIALIWGLDG